jgi:putative endonuclease
VSLYSMTQYSYVYMLANQRNGTLYIGVTTDLLKRAWEHKYKVVEGFSNEHNIDKLVWFEQHETIEAAITREKQMKKWRRAWKIRQIEAANPYWNDLYEDLTA